MNLASIGSYLWEHWSKLVAKLKEYLENDYWISFTFANKLAILNPDVEMDTDIDNYKIVLNMKWSQKKYWMSLAFIMF
nr:hypothetical protein [Mycoplasmopsis bovis]